MSYARRAQRGPKRKFGLMKTTKNDCTMVYSGTSGLVLPVPNKRSFPAAFRDKSRLTYYASLFNSVEINSSFKKVPMLRTVEKWAAAVPDGFQFTFKLPAAITHNKELTFNPGDVHHFLQVVAPIGDKKGCLLVQFPGKLNVGYSGQLENLLRAIRQSDPEGQWKIAIEFRNVSWYNNEIYHLLDLYQMSLVLHDMPLSTTSLNHGAAAFVYVRFHGPEKGYRGSYSDDFLYSYAQHIKAWRDEQKEVYVYFNNTLGDAANNLITLNRFIAL